MTYRRWTLYPVPTVHGSWCITRATLCVIDFCQPISRGMGWGDSIVPRKEMCRSCVAARSVAIPPNPNFSLQKTGVGTNLLHQVLTPEKVRVGAAQSGDFMSPTALVN